MFTSTEVPVILKAYVKGIQTAFIVSIALAGAATIIAFMASWGTLEPAEGEGEAPRVEKGGEPKEVV